MYVMSTRAPTNPSVSRSCIVLAKNGNKIVNSDLRCVFYFFVSCTCYIKFSCLLFDMYTNVKTVCSTMVTSLLYPNII